jgi:hypothetical protein
MSTDAARLLGATAAHRDWTGDRPHAAGLRRSTAVRTALVEALGDGAFQEAFDLGRQATFADVIESTRHLIAATAGTSTSTLAPERGR